MLKKSMSLSMSMLASNRENNYKGGKYLSQKISHQLLPKPNDTILGSDGLVHSVGAATSTLHPMNLLGIIGIKYPCALPPNSWILRHTIQIIIHKSEVVKHNRVIRGSKKIWLGKTSETGCL